MMGNTVCFHSLSKQVFLISLTYEFGSQLAGCEIWVRLARLRMKLSYERSKRTGYGQMNRDKAGRMPLNLHCWPLEQPKCRRGDQGSGDYGNGVVGQADNRMRDKEYENTSVRHH